MWNKKRKDAQQYKQYNLSVFLKSYMIKYTPTCMALIWRGINEKKAMPVAGSKRSPFLLLHPSALISTGQRVNPNELLWEMDILRLMFNN